MCVRPTRPAIREGQRDRRYGKVSETGELALTNVVFFSKGCDKIQHYAAPAWDFRPKRTVML